MNKDADLLYASSSIAMQNPLALNWYSCSFVNVMYRRAGWYLCLGIYFLVLWHRYIRDLNPRVMKRKDSGEAL